MIQWRGGEPFAELNIQLFLSGFVFLLLPLFFISTIFKVSQKEKVKKKEEECENQNP